MGQQRRNKWKKELFHQIKNLIDDNKLDLSKIMDGVRKRDVDKKRDRDIYRWFGRIFK